MRKVYNFVAFQAAWFATVVAAARGHEWLGIAAASVVLLVHCWIARTRRGELAFLCASVPIGFVVNEFLQRTDAVVGVGDIWPSSMSPLWLLVMWPLFATLFNESMSWMRGRFVVGVVFGVVGAPLSYLGGVRMGAIHVNDDPWHWVTLVALAWGITMPVMLALQQRFTPLRTHV